MHNDISKIVITEEEIRDKIRELGQAITKDYADVARSEGIVLICVLRGAATFMADLGRAIELPLEMDYMAVSSYGNSTQSSGQVRILKDLSSSIQGKHVIIAEDILDSGLTLMRLMEELKCRRPASLEVCTFLRKDRPNQAPINCRYIGFECPNEFIVGYGLDYAERYRNLPYVGVLKPEVYE
ncbi:MAG: hypoxanthine phosphoribosyltransferase [Eggerthellaceae bacterium]|nr:hypoxanthine phosphoribosyltransferase [Eggerthellaceae bacterium]